jgi:hypothetical protein
VRVVHLLRLGGEKDAGGVMPVAQLSGKVDAFGAAFQIYIDESQIRALGPATRRACSAEPAGSPT